jgi:hypothetical protein
MTGKRPYGRFPRQPGQVVRPQYTECPICVESHDPIVQLLFESQFRRIADEDLTAELVYVQRELLDDPDERGRAWMVHHLTVLEGEAQRRRRIAANGGPLYRAQSSVTRERIDGVKKIDVADVITRDLPIAWMRGHHTWFYCAVHHPGGEKHPSLRANSETGLWYCWGCRQGGDLITWMLVRHNLGFREAIEELEKWAA